MVEQLATKLNYRPIVNETAVIPMAKLRVQRSHLIVSFGFQIYVNEYSKIELELLIGEVQPPC